MRIENKDVTWEYSDEEYEIKNVPVQIDDEEEMLDLDVAMKIGALRDLMIEGEIPKEITFDQFEDIEW